MKVHLYLLLLLCFSLNCFGIESSNSPHEKTLLWRVHSPAQTYDSYLYGTMHMRDERVYEFADSVLLALSRCHFFAAEQRLDTLMARMLVELFDTTSGIRLKDVVHGAQLDSLSQELAGMISVPASMIPNLRCGLIAELMSHEENTLGKRATFLDAYLLGLARALGKELKAMEGREGSMDLIDKMGAMGIRQMLDSTGRTKPDDAAETDAFIRIYVDQNIDSMAGAFVEQMQTERGLIDSLLYLRNIVMAKSFDSLHKHASLFAAVGAAHLGGQKGIIEQLRDKGYVVEAVKPSYTGLRHIFDTVDVTANAQWYEFRSEHNGFSLRMPAQLSEAPIYKKAYQSMDMDMPQCSDIISGLQFVAIGMRNTGFSDAAQRDDMANTMAAAYFTDVNAARRNDAPGYLSSYHGNACYEYQGTSKFSSQLRLRVVLSRTTMVALIVLGTDENINSSMVKTYMNSLEFSPQKREAWMPMVDSINNVQVDMLGKALSTNIGSAAAPVHVFYSTDPQSGNTFVYQYNWIGDRVAGASLSAMVTNLMDGPITQGKVQDSLIFDSPSDVELRCRYVLRADSQGVTKYGQIVIRRRHMYFFEFGCADSTKRHDDSAHFFSSIHLLPQSDSSVWSEFHDDSLRLTVLLPASPLREDEVQSPESYYVRTITLEAFDESAEKKCGVQSYQVSPYFYAASPDTLLNKFLRPQRVAGDTLLSFNRTDIDQSLIYDFVLARKKSYLATRYRVVIRGRMMYIAFMYLHQVNTKSAEIDNFIRSLVLPPSDGFDLRQNKGQLWLKDVLSADSAIANKARAAVSWVDVNPACVPELKALLLRSSFNDDSNYSKADCETGSNGPFRSAVLALLNDYPDSLTVEYLTKLYKSSAKYPTLQCEILGMMSGTKREDVMRLYFQLLKSDAKQLAANPTFSVLSFPGRCENNVSLIAHFIPQLQELYSVPSIKMAVLALLEDLVSTQEIKREAVHLREAELLRDLQLATNLWEKFVHAAASGTKPEAELRDSAEKSASLATFICEWFESVNYSTTVEKELRDVLRVYSAYVPVTSVQAARSLLVQHRPVPDSLLLKCVQNPGDGMNIVSLLDSLGLRKQLPSNYFSQEYIAEGILRDDNSDTDGPGIDSVVVLSEHLFAIDSVQSRFFLLKFNYERGVDEDKTSAQPWCVVLVGTFDLDETNIVAHKKTIRFSTKAFDEQSIEKHLQDCVNSDKIEK